MDRRGRLDIMLLLNFLNMLRYDGCLERGADRDVCADLCLRRGDLINDGC